MKRTMGCLYFTSIYLYGKLGPAGILTKKSESHKMDPVIIGYKAFMLLLCIYLRPFKVPKEKKEFVVVEFY